VLGPRRLPEAGRSLGRGLREFKESVTSAVDAHEDRGHLPRDFKNPSVKPIMRQGLACGARRS
jgi:Sec-independent protein translocase protein TatA